MKTTPTIKKTFDSVKFFRVIKEKLAEGMAGMTLEQQKEFLRQVREGKIKIM
jgi:ERCC4-related helicase